MVADDPLPEILIALADLAVVAIYIRGYGREET
jgi:hypothetical protein